MRVLFKDCLNLNINEEVRISLQKKQYLDLFGWWGVIFHEVRIIFFYHIHDYGEIESHMTIEGKTTGGDWERFYEGGCDEFEDFENLIRMLKFEI